MKMHNYMKKEKILESGLNRKSIGASILDSLLLHKKRTLRVVGIGTLLMILSVVFVNRNVGECSMDDFSSLKIAEMPIAASSSQKSVISIPSGIVKANPFVPYRDITRTSVINDVPTFAIIEPPEVINENSDAARVMDTIVSGILYDKFSPSAIINIEGQDYLVKKGDVVNNYKVTNIAQDSVTVQLGSNTYKAGIGEILTEGNLNRNEVSNLNNKFGGER